MPKSPPNESINVSLYQIHFPLITVDEDGLDCPPLYYIYKCANERRRLQNGVYSSIEKER